MNRTLGVIIMVSVLWIVVANIFYQPRHDSIERPEVNYKAPGFTLPTLGGDPLSVKDARGKPLVINFWASWCGPCEDEVPELMDLYKKHQGQFELYGVDMTSTDTMGALKAFVRDHHVDYPILLDKKGTVADKYDVRAYPTTYLVDEDGLIVKEIKGYSGKTTLHKAIESLISDD